MIGFDNAIGQCTWGIVKNVKDGKSWDHRSHKHACNSTIECIGIHKLHVFIYFAGYNLKND